MVSFRSKAERRWPRCRGTGPLAEFVQLAAFVSAVDALAPQRLGQRRVVGYVIVRQRRDLVEHFVRDMWRRARHEDLPVPIFAGLHAR